MKERFDLSRVIFVGASASGLLSTLTACGVEPRRAIDSAKQIADEAHIWSRTLGLLGIWGGLVRKWLGDLLPEDAAEQCNGRVCLLLSHMTMRGFRHVYVDQYVQSSQTPCQCMPSRSTWAVLGCQVMQDCVESARVAAGIAAGMTSSMPTWPPCTSLGCCRGARSRSFVAPPSMMAPCTNQRWRLRRRSLSRTAKACMSWT